MPSAVLRNASDTSAVSTSAARNYRQSRSLLLKSAERFAYVYFNRAAPRGSNITSALLRFYHRDAWGSSSRSITVKRIDEPWKASRLTWNNRPAVTGTGRTITDAGGPDGTLVEIDVTGLLQVVSNGARWLGFRIETDDATARELYSSNANISAMRPTLEVSWTTAPQQPTDLSPDGNRAVSTSKPTLRFSFVDELGDTSLGQVRVQIDPTDTAWDGTPAFDSGAVDADAPELDLSETAFAGIGAGTSLYWRARVSDGAGLWSDWSDSARFKRVNKGTLTLLSPSGSTVSEPTPLIIWSLTGAVQKAWQVRIVDDDDRSREIADSGRHKGSDTSWTVPDDDKLKDGKDYQLTVRIWDGDDREGTPGDPVFTATSKVVVVNDVPGVTPVNTLEVTQRSIGRVDPRMALTWKRATAPDRFIVLRDGDVIENRLDPAEAIDPETPTQYLYIDNNARPWRVHEWRVKAVENGEQSDPRLVSETPRSVGIWVYDKARDLTVWIADKQSGAWALGEDATVFAPLNGTKIVRRVQSQRGLEGNISGYLVTKFGQEWWQWERDLMKMRDEPNNAVIISMADLSIKAILGNVTTYPTTNVPPSRVVSIDFWEVE